jgi:hypothetical protein
VQSVVSHLGRTLGIDRGEERVFACGAITLFLVGSASVSLTNVSETYFLKRVGVDRLPLVFLLNMLLLIGSTYFVSRLASRSTRRHLLAGTLAVLAGVPLLLWFLVLAHVSGVYVLLVIATKQLDAIALLVFWIVLGGLLHPRQAKRLYAPIIAGGTLGRILGSFASGAIGNVLGIPSLLLASAIPIGLASLLAVRIRTTVPAPVARMTGRRLPSQPLGTFTKFQPLWRESRLFRLLVVCALLAGCVGPMLYFQFSYIVDMATRGSNGEIRLLDLYAKVRGFINAGVLGLQLVGTARIFRRIGVPLASVLSPLVYLVGFAGVSTRLDLPSGIGAIGGTNLQDHAIQEPAQRILATLFPERVRAAATSLIDGPVQRTGGALGNILVLCALAVSSPAWIGFTALPIAAMWLAAAIVLWRIYPALLLEVAAARAHTDVAPGLRQLVDPGTVRVLERSLIDPDPRRCRAACTLVIEALPASAVTTLARAICAAPPVNRGLLVETLHQLLERNPGVHRPVPKAAQQIEPLLADATFLRVDERAHLVEVYAHLKPSLRLGTPAGTLVTQLLSDAAPAVRLAATVWLHQAGPCGTGNDLDALLADAAVSGDDSVRRIALEALRTLLLSEQGSRTADDMTRWNRRMALIAARLVDPRDRALAARTLADVTVHRGPAVAACGDLVLPYAGDPDPQVRAAVLRFVGRARLEAKIPWAIERLGSDDETEAAAAAQALRDIGPVALTPLLTASHFGRRAVREAVLPILHDMPCDAAVLRARIGSEINGIQRLVLQLSGLRAGDVSQLVLQRIEERIAEGLHTTLLMLAMQQHNDQIAALGHLLYHSRDGRGRAVVIEALEALLRPAENARLLALLEGGSVSGAAVAAAEALGRPLPSFDDAVRETLTDTDALTRAFLLASLGATRLALISGAISSATDSGAQNVAAAGMVAGRDLEDHTARRDGISEDTMNQVDIILHLRSLDLFARLTTRELSELSAVVREETYPAGAAIVREGEFGDCMYVVVEGEARITRAGEFLADRRPMEFFGEMALFDGETRSATITATTRLRLLRIERTDLLRLMEEQPGMAINMCQTLSRHVRGLIDRLESRTKDRGES